MSEKEQPSAEIDERSATALYSWGWQNEQLPRSSEPIKILGKINDQPVGNLSASLIVRREFDSVTGQYVDKSKTINIGDMQVRADLRSKGTGKAMLAELEKTAGKLGVTEVTGKVTQSDLNQTPWLLEFYKQRGFEITEREAGWEISKHL